MIIFHFIIVIVIIIIIIIIIVSATKIMLLNPAQESLDPIKLLGCAIGIGGVFLYSIVDNIFPPAGKEAKK